MSVDMFTCPVCGAEGRMCTLFSINHDWGRAECHECGCAGPEVRTDDYDGSDYYSEWRTEAQREFENAARSVWIKTTDIAPQGDDEEFVAAYYRQGARIMLVTRRIVREFPYPFPWWTPLPRLPEVVKND